ncbi:hypothetical protein BV22DRAFT_567126 [Leucogyrophana mollusca]|uniref:Uncharacterized protein n=1 Tax=Leucogyrophana mollusca TaxID=85980 RepID=A0ACB8BE24_9AGAM|nr:hypothetical protein BV22DRAFT_567126 [Leucogyrophana mollusca]
MQKAGCFLDPLSSSVKYMQVTEIFGNSPPAILCGLWRVPKRDVLYITAEGGLVHHLEQVLHSMVSLKRTLLAFALAAVANATTANLCKRDNKSGADWKLYVYSSINCSENWAYEMFYSNHSDPGCFKINSKRINPMKSLALTLDPSANLRVSLFDGPPGSSCPGKPLWKSKPQIKEFLVPDLRKMKDSKRWEGITSFYVDAP